MVKAGEYADYLVKKGLAFRDSHHVTGSIVKYASNLKIPIECLSLEVLKDFSTVIDGDVYKALLAPINSKLSLGSTNVVDVKKDIRRLKNWMAMI